MWTPLDPKTYKRYAVISSSTRLSFSSFLPRCISLHHVVFCTHFDDPSNRRARRPWLNACCAPFCLSQSQYQGTHHLYFDRPVPGTDVFRVSSNSERRAYLRYITHDMQRLDILHSTRSDRWQRYIPLAGRCRSGKSCLRRGERHGYHEGRRHDDAPGWYEPELVSAVRRGYRSFP